MADEQEPAGETKRRRRRQPAMPTDLPSRSDPGVIAVFTPSTDARVRGSVIGGTIVVGIVVCFFTALSLMAHANPLYGITLSAFYIGVILLKDLRHEPSAVTVLTDCAIEIHHPGDTGTQTITWADIRAVRVHRRGWNQRVEIVTHDGVQPHTQRLPMPSSADFARDPQFDDQTQLLLDTWEAHRGEQGPLFHRHVTPGGTYPAPADDPER